MQTVPGQIAGIAAHHFLGSYLYEPIGLVYANFAEPSGQITTYTNGAFHTVRTFRTNDVVTRDVLYIFADDEAAWVYQLQTQVGGNWRQVSTGKQDSKNFDPRIRSAIQQAELEVESRKFPYHGTDGYEGPRQERLRASGIQWRTLRELNPELVKKPARY